MKLFDDEVIPRKPPFPSRFSQYQQLLIIPTDNGLVTALDIDNGEFKWAREIQSGSNLRTMGLAVWRDKLVLGGENLADLPAYNCSLLIWDAETGSDAWSWATKGDNISIPQVVQDVAYFTSSEPKLYALNLETRQLLWSAPALPWSPEAVAVAGETIIVASRGPVVAAYHRNNGEKLWSFSVDDRERETLHQRPVVSADTVYLSGWGKRLYAVDCTTGDLRWRFEAQRGITNPPVLMNGKLLVGVKDLMGDRDSPAPGYGLYALEAATGETVWKYATEKHIYTCPVYTDDMVMFGADDSRLHALDLETGRELWQFSANDMLRSGPYVYGNRVVVGQGDGTFYCVQWKENQPDRVAPERLIAEGKPIEAAAELAQDGQYEAAARLYADNGLLENAAALFLEADLPGKAADIYVALKEYGRALTLRQQAGDRLGEGNALALLGNHSDAAKVYEEAGSLDLAVQEYVAAGRAGYAASILLKAGRRKEAADLFSSINENDRAAEALVEDARYGEAAEIYRSVGKLEAAADLFVQGGQLAEAAMLNEQLGNPVVAAKLYALVGQFERALPLYESLEDWKSVAEFARETGDLIRQANALARLGQNEQAAEAYERAGKLDTAVALYETLGRWEKAASLYGSMERWDRQAEILAQMGFVIQAGEAYIRAAEQLEQKDPAVGAEMAGLYERAAKCFQDGDDWQHYETCWDRVCYYRQWPNIKGRFENTPQFYEGEYALVKLAVKNIGYSVARNIGVQKISQKFQTDETETRAFITLLGPQREKAMLLSIKPRKEVVGQVLLHVTLVYWDAAGIEHQALCEQSVSVLGRDEKMRVVETTPFPDELKVSVPAGFDLSRLRRGMVEYFNEEDLQELCFDLQIDYEALAGETKSRKAMELILYMGRYGRLPELVEECRKRRPKVIWG